jgi:large subunit ribosomal protein L6e
MESKKKERKPHAPRNWPLVKSYGTMLMRYSRSTMYRKHAVYKLKPVIGAPKPVEKKPRFKEVQMKNGTRQVPIKRMPRSLPTETVPRRIRSTKQKAFKDHARRLRKSITPGTVLIVLAGRHKAKHVIFLKQLASGLLLVSGPRVLNGCPLRRLHQKLVIATSTKVDISGIQLPERLTDAYFKRNKLTDRRSKQANEDIFAQTKQTYTVSAERKEDQKAVDTQLLAAIKKHPDGTVVRKYLKTLFELKHGQFPHQMKF